MFHAAFWWAIAGIAPMINEFSASVSILFFFGIGALVAGLVATAKSIRTPNRKNGRLILRCPLKNRPAHPFQQL